MPTDHEDHFNLKPKRKAEFYPPSSQLKVKVGNGGLAEDVMDKAQAMLDNNTVDFRPLGEMYLEAIMHGVDHIKSLPNSETTEDAVISSVLFPAMQLKANGGMFQYQLVTQIADRMIQFLEVIERVDTDALDIIQAFHTTIRAILLGQIKGDGGNRGKELIDALNSACYRYFDKYPDRKPS